MGLMIRFVRLVSGSNHEYHKKFSKPNSFFDQDSGDSGGILARVYEDSESCQTLAENARRLFSRLCSNG